LALAKCCDLGHAGVGGRVIVLEPQTPRDTEIRFALSWTPTLRLASIHLELRPGSQITDCGMDLTARSTNAQLAQMPKRHLFENGTRSLAI